jgi:hypothetical protein
MMHKVQSSLLTEPLEPLKPYSTNVILAMQKHVPPDRRRQRKRMNDKHTQREQPKRGENHRREWDGVVPRDVPLRPNPSVREQLPRILRVMPADMHVAKCGDAAGVPKNAMEKYLDERGRVVGGNSNDNVIKDAQDHNAMDFAMLGTILVILDRAQNGSLEPREKSVIGFHHFPS